MADNKDFEAIMKEITGGLTGDPEADIKYLDEQGQKYKDHEYGKEILRACGRLMYQLIPEDKKAELNKALAKDNMGYDAAMEEVRFNIYKKNYDKALKLIEDMISKYEKSEMFKDDAVSEYHCFREPMEEILYCEYIKPEKDIRRANYDYADMYLTYGSLLVELKRLDDAADALFTAMKREIYEETGIMLKVTDDIRMVNPLVFNSPGFTDECTALIAMTAHLDDLSELNQKGAVGSEKFAGFLLATREEVLRLLRDGKDPRGHRYPMVTWCAMMYFVSDLWKA